MDGRTGDRKIVLKVRLNQAEYDALAAMSAATGYPMGAILRNGIRHNKQFSPLGQEQERCQAPQYAPPFAPAIPGPLLITTPRHTAGTSSHTTH